MASVPLAAAATSCYYCDGHGFSFQITLLLPMPLWIRMGVAKELEAVVEEGIQVVVELPWSCFVKMAIFMRFL